MSANLPVTQTVQITKKKSYSLVLKLCNDNAPGSFTAEATPVFSEALGIQGYASPADAETALLTFVPGDQLRVQSGTKTPPGAVGAYPVLEVREKVSLSCAKQGTAVTTIFPFGASFQPHIAVGSIVPLYLAAENAPTSYTYTVKYDGKQIAKGDVVIAIKPGAETPPPTDFSVCDVKVT